MKKTALSAALVALSLSLVLSSCDAMFNTNLFKAAGLGQFKLSNADLSTASGVQTAADSSPQTFYSQLAADPTSESQVLTTLVGDPSNPSTTASDSNKVLAAAIEINTTDAGAAVNNVAGQIPTLMQSSTIDASSISTFVKNVLPSDIVVTPNSPMPQAFSDMVTSFQQAAPLLSSLNTTTALDPVPGGTSADTAYYALVSIAIDSIQPTSSYPTTADALWAVLTNPTVSNPSTAITFNTNNTFNTTTGGTVYNLLTDAGIDPTKFQSSN